MIDEAALDQAVRRFPLSIMFFRAYGWIPNGYLDPLRREYRRILRGKVAQELSAKNAKAKFLLELHERLAHGLG